MTHHIVIFRLEIYLVDWWNLIFGADSLLRYSLPLSHLFAVSIDGYWNLFSFFLCLYWSLKREVEFRLTLNNVCLFSWVNLFKFDVKVFLDKRIKPIFDFILWSTWKKLANLWPFASNFAVQLENFTIFIITPIFSFDLRIELIDKSLSYLLAIFGAQHLRK